MKPILIACAAVALGLSAPHAMAANARMPYQNVNHGNDKGNDTGDNRVDALNAAQLDQNYKGPYYAFTPGAGPGPSATPPAPMTTDEASSPAKTMKRPMRSQP